MKRETILFYLGEEKISLYQVNSKKEYAYKLDTSLFLKWGEISDVNRLSKEVSKIASKLSLGLLYLRPNFVVLYNDVCHCDIKFLYKSALLPFGYNKVYFAPITKVVGKIKDSDNLVLFSQDYYTIINKREKASSIEGLDFEPIIIGKSKDEYIHYSDEDIVFKTFKSCFTNDDKYGIMDIGDDNV